MNLLRSVFAISVQNIRKWQTDYRVWFVGIMVFIMVQMYIDETKTTVSIFGTEMPIWIYPFICTGSYFKPVFTLPVILLFCNAPFIDANQTFVFMRCGRQKWLCGQIIYVVAASAIYFIFLLALTLLCTVFTGELSLEWGKTLTVASYSGSGSGVSVSAFVISFFTPLSATWFTFLLSWLCGIMLGLMIFFFNILTGTRFVGITVSSLLVVLSIFVSSGFAELLPFSPVSWNTVDNIDVGGLTANPSFGYCITVYLVLIAALTAGIFIFGKRQSMDVKGH